jgi:osmotically-inducible protein OsmY
MKKYIITFLLGLFLGASGYWTVRDGPLASKIQKQAVYTKTVDALETEALKRTADEVKTQMEQGGQAMMTKPSSGPVIADDLLNNLVKAKIAADPIASKAEIDVDTEQGEVTLKGTASSYEQVARAMQLALDCNATSMVTSKIKVKTP